jgi:hypothetical protein
VNLGKIPTNLNIAAGWILIPNKRLFDLKLSNFYDWTKPFGK